MFSSIKTRASLALVLVGLIWGYAFVVMKNQLDSFSVFELLFWRFLIAFIVLALCFRSPNFFHMGDKKIWKDGMIAGFLLFVGYVFQTFGLKYTSVVNSGIITVFYVVFTPLIAFFLDKKNVSRKSFFACFLAFFGLFFILAEGLNFDSLFSNRGDFLTLGCAVAYAGHIIYIAKKSKLYNVFKFTSIQMFAICSFSFFSSFLFDGKLSFPESADWSSLIFLGIVVSAVTFVLQVWAQRILSSSSSAILLTLEAPFAIFFGIALLGDNMLTQKWIGVGIVAISIIMVLVEEFKMDKKMCKNE
tara:strand:- start:5555 stop:6460 length:906 start_codon:yes stop_codon:yes gene_type:complete